MRRMAWLLGTCLLLGSGCSSEDRMLAEPASPPELLPPRSAMAPGQRGPYAVGVTTMEVEGATGRTLPVEVWYPADPRAGAPIERYQLLVGALVIAEVTSPLEAARDAPLDYRGAPHPTVLFSHGYGATRLQSIYLTEHLASHGFVVVAPDHVGNTIRELIDTASAEVAIESMRQRPEDIRRTLDAILARSEGWPDDPLAFAVDADRLGVAGHSFGALTTYRLAGATHDPTTTTAYCDATDSAFCDGWPPSEPLPVVDDEPRFRAALPQSPGGVEAFGDDGLGSIAMPVMIHGGTLDVITPYDTEAQAFFDRATTDTTLVTVEDAGHYTFSDMCPMIEVIGLTAEEFDDGCSDDNLAFDVGQRIANEYAAAFFRRHLVGDDRDAELLSGDRPLEHTTVSTR